LLDSWIDFNKKRREWILRRIAESNALSRKSPRIALWGLAYKPGTHSLKNAPSLEVLHYLRAYDISVYDPEVTLPPEYQSGKIRQTANALDAVTDSDLLVIMTPWQEFSSYEIDSVFSRMKDGIVVDPYGVYSKQMNSSAHYITMGR
jgi:UDPglucose 6-dehydrogenase